MSLTRRAVLEALADASSGYRRETTTVESLSSALDANEATVATHLNGLAECELARTYPNGRVRVTVTGEDLLALDVDGVVVDPGATGSDG